MEFMQPLKEIIIKVNKYEAIEGDLSDLKRLLILLYGLILLYCRVNS